jgi:hypothetical protein
VSSTNDQDWEERERWKCLLGELVIQFARIEALALDAILVNGDIETVALSDRFTERAKLAITTVNKSTAGDNLKKELVAKLNKAIQLADLRNDFVHNPMRLKLAWALGETDQVYEIEPPRKNRPHTIRNLEKAVKDTLNCAENLYNLVGTFSWRVHDQHAT